MLFSFSRSNELASICATWDEVPAAMFDNIQQVYLLNIFFSWFKSQVKS
jgi:hypothetical protein